MNSPYDSFAWFYHRYWAAPHGEWQTPAMEKLLCPGLPYGAGILDLCCGTGHLSKWLTRRGYKVTGVDASAEMLRFAREDVPEACFLHADATRFVLKDRVDAAACTFDSLNHILQPEQLLLAFRSVHGALKPGGRFLFDVNTEAAYGERWNGSATETQPDHVFFLRGRYDRQAMLGGTKITMFRLLTGSSDAHWQRADVEVLQRPWEVPALQHMLASAGFTGVQAFRPREDLGMDGHLGEGRVYVIAYRP